MERWIRISVTPAPRRSKKAHPRYSFMIFFAKILRVLLRLYSLQIQVLEAQKCPKNVPTKIRLFSQKLRETAQAIEREGDWVVARPGIEPGTQGFSVLCSTN